ncbi:MAG: cyclase family protein [Treponema sp.]|jgi:kynurenine formamidase|nr:cyclase family protein [Treponema sp.]
MNKVIDLTQVLKDGMLVFPGDPCPEFKTAHRYDNGYFVSVLTICTHTGTHVDAPVHRIEGKKTLTDLSADRYIGWKTLVMDFPNMGKGGVLSRADCNGYEQDIDGCDAVLVRTGWGRFAGKAEYYDGFPGLDEGAADWLLAHRIRLIALESPSVNPQKHLEIHKKLLENEILIVEGLVNTELLKSKYVELHAVPLKLDRLDGSPVRAYAVERN